MTNFIDGPQERKTLMLKRAPMFLRAVLSATGTWDALDQVTDEPEPTEKVFAYVIDSELGSIHINRGGGRGGFYTTANYKLVAEQPADEIMRTAGTWQAWCRAAATAAKTTP